MSVLFVGALANRTAASGRAGRRGLEPRHLRQRLCQSTRLRLTCRSSGRFKACSRTLWPAAYLYVRPHCAQSARHRLGQCAFVRAYFEHQSNAPVARSSVQSSGKAVRSVRRGQRRSGAWPSGSSAASLSSSAGSSYPSFGGPLTAAQAAAVQARHAASLKSCVGLPSVARFEHTRRMRGQDRPLGAALQSSASRGGGSARSNPGVWSNPSIERTFQRPLRALWPAAHVKR